MAKRSRRERRLETEKQRQTPAVSFPVEPEVYTPQLSPPPLTKGAEAAPASSRKTVVNFAQEYFYVYRELVTILIITVLMFVVMAGLSFVI
ncbi:MAG: hypothetical protein HYR94_09285 [Chloroflexi bacterium]|nr:hypothetical protein [Chloroflexota bacterium]